MVYKMALRRRQRFVQSNFKILKKFLKLKIIALTNEQINSNTLSGDNPSITAKVIQNGGALFSPIQDDMLRTYHEVPQVKQIIYIIITLLSLQKTLVAKLFYANNSTLWNLFCLIIW